jgi:hypothetical protein
MTVSPAAAAFARDRILESCDLLIQQLRNLPLGRGSSAVAVHEVRKLAKAVRGGLALFRLESSAGREVQAVGRMLSGARDAASRQATWERVAWQEDATMAGVIGSLLAHQSKAVSRRPPAGVMAWGIARMEAAEDMLRKLPADSLTESLRRGLARLERRLGQRCRRLECGADARFHEARKALKAWMGALGFLPPGLRRVHPSLNRLADWLGDENDLAELSGWLAAHGFTKRFAPGLWARVGKGRRRLQRKVIRHLPQRMA